jgi:hypothetical protein
MISIGSNITFLNAAFDSYSYSDFHDSSSCEIENCLRCMLEEKEATPSAYPDQNVFDTTNLFSLYPSTNPQSSSYYANPKSSTDDTSIDALPKPKKIQTPPSSWFSTLCVLTSLGIIGYDIYETNKLKKEEADDATTEPFIILQKKASEPNKKTIFIKEGITEEKEEEARAIEQATPEKIAEPKPVLPNSKQKPITQQPNTQETKDHFAFIKKVQENLTEKIKPHYKNGKEQTKIWFKDLKQNPREHKKLIASGVLLTLALAKKLL